MRLTDFQNAVWDIFGLVVSFNAAGNGSSSLQLYSDPEADVPETAGGFLLNQMQIELPFHDRYPALPGAEADYRGRLSGLQLQNFYLYDAVLRA